jgi:hypothetical protein
MAGRGQSEMTHSIQNERKRDAHEAMVRDIVDVAREVRVHLRDEQVIFGTVTPTERAEGGSFRIRPWGTKESIQIQFAAVALASAVKQMGWLQHRAIAAAQQAGIFTTSRRAVK